VTLIHVKDLQRLSHSLSSGRTKSDAKVIHGAVIVYVHRGATQDGYHIVDIMPSLKSLYKNEKCSVSATDYDIVDYSTLFRVDEHQGTNTLKLSTSLNESTVYRLTVTCHALLGNRNDPFILPVELHVV
jgi:hypothetical protein